EDGDFFEIYIVNHNLLDVEDGVIDANDFTQVFFPPYRFVAALNDRVFVTQLAKRFTVNDDGYNVLTRVWESDPFSTVDGQTFNLPAGGFTALATSNVTVSWKLSQFEAL